MHTTIIIAHPKPDSLTHRLAQEFTRGLNDSGHSASIVDLYADGFDPVLSANEQRDVHNNIIKTDIRQQQKLLQQSQGLVLMYPIWWASMPAILQGWLQRVLSYGFAFTYVNNERTGLLTHKVQVIINSGTGDRSLETTYLEPLQYIFHFCGVEKLNTNINWNLTANTNKEVINETIHTAYILGKDFFKEKKSALLQKTH